MTRGGPAEEWLWANYQRPELLHDYRYIGGSFPERWRIHKRQRSWLKMLGRMPAIERRAMLAAIADAHAAEVLSYLGLDASSSPAASDARGACRSRIGSSRDVKGDGARAAVPSTPATQ